MSRVTLKQVATFARISYQPDLKVLNQQIGVSTDTKASTEQAARDLGYQPDLVGAACPGHAAS